MENNEEWIRCPICKNKTRVKMREDTILVNFPLFCPKCNVGRQIVTGGNCTLKSITLPVTACISGTDGNLCQVQLHVIAALFQLNELKFN